MQNVSKDASFSNQNARGIQKGSVQSMFISPFLPQAV